MARSRARNGKLIKSLWRRWRKRQQRLRRERERAAKVTARNAAKRRGATRVRATEAQPVGDPGPGHALLALHGRAAMARARVLGALGTDEQAQQWARDDAAAVEQERHRAKLRRLERRHVFLCGGHTPPQRFATAAELNEHMATEHTEPVVHPRGQVAKPAPKPRQLPKPAPRAKTRPPVQRPAPDSTDTARRTREHNQPVGAANLPRPTPVPGGRVATRRRNPTSERDIRLRVIKHHMDKIRQEAVSNVSAGNATAALGDIGSAPIRNVSQIREIATAIEALGLAFEEAIEGFQQNARTSETAPIKEEVLRTLDAAKEGGQMVATAAVAFVSAFDDEYGPDIREAQAGERMDNSALTS